MKTIGRFGMGLTSLTAPFPNYQDPRCRFLMGRVRRLLALAPLSARPCLIHPGLIVSSWGSASLDFLAKRFGIDRNSVSERIYSHEFERTVKDICKESVLRRFSESYHDPLKSLYQGYEHRA